MAMSNATSNRRLNRLEQQLLEQVEEQIAGDGPVPVELLKELRLLRAAHDRREDARRRAARSGATTKKAKDAKPAQAKPEPEPEPEQDEPQERGDCQPDDEPPPEPDIPAEPVPFPIDASVNDVSAFGGKYPRAKQVRPLPTPPASAQAFEPPEERERKELIAAAKHRAFAREIGELSDDAIMDRAKAENPGGGAGYVRAVDEYLKLKRAWLVYEADRREHQQNQAATRKSRAYVKPRRVEPKIPPGYVSRVFIGSYSVGGASPADTSGGESDGAEQHAKRNNF